MFLFNLLFRMNIFPIKKLFSDFLELFLYTNIYLVSIWLVFIKLHIEKKNHVFQRTMNLFNDKSKNK